MTTKSMVKAHSKVPKRRTTIRSRAHKVWRLAITPTGKQLFTYMLAVLTAEGGFTASRKVMSRESIKAHFDTGSCITHHSGLKRLEATRTGLRLSVQGWSYFHGRVNGKNPAQQVMKEDVAILAKALKTGKMPEKASAFGMNTEFMQVTVT